MKVAILDILKNTFMVVKNKNTTMIAVNKRPRRFKRNDGLYWLEGLKPTPVKDILTIFK